MIDKINVQIRRRGELLKEIEEENVIVITETACGELYAHIGISEAVLLAVQLTKEYDRLVNWIKKSFGIDTETVSDLIKIAQMNLGIARREMVIRTKGDGQ